MALSDDLTATALRLINDFGSDITLVKPSSSTYDFESGTTDVIAGTETILKATVDSYESEEVKGLVIEGDIKMMISSNGVTIGKDDTIKFQNEVYQIINVMPLYLQNNIVVFNLQVRK